MESDVLLVHGCIHLDLPDSSIWYDAVMEELSPSCKRFSGAIYDVGFRGRCVTWGSESRCVACGSEGRRVTCGSNGRYVACGSEWQSLTCGSEGDVLYVTRWAICGMWFGGRYVTWLETCSSKRRHVTICHGVQRGDVWHAIRRGDVWRTTWHFIFIWYGSVKLWYKLMCLT